MTPAEQNARISLEHSSASRSPLLEVRDLRVEFEGTAGLIAPVESVSFDVGRGERVAIVGESGSGKSVTAMAILGLTEFTGGAVNPKSSIRFDGREVLLMNETERRGIRGGGIAMIFQDPLTSLNPLHSVGAQVAEAVRLHNPGVSTSAAAARSRELFELVQLPRAATLTRSHPHELSGGMRQRVMIAMALAGNPKLLLADEPTTALDVTVQAGILDLLRDIGEERDLSVLMITHDLSVVAGFADRILVMYGGRIVEEGLTEPIFRKPHHPYTHALLGSIPRLDEEPERLIAIEGSPPEPGHRPSGCAFRTRCPYEIDACAEVIPALTLTDSGAAACIRSADIDLSSRRPAQRPPLALRAQEKTSARIILEVRGLSKQYRVRSQTGRRETVNALSGVSFALEEGASLGIIGQSGSGKSTLARCLGALTSPTSGRIIAAGEDIVGANRRTLKSYRRQMQMVFQDPSSSLDQRMRVRDILAEPLRIHGVWRDDPKKSEAQLRSLVDAVKLPANALERYPREFSGGQRQRIAIARALAVEPKMLICDEPVSALDVSVRSSILNLLAELRQEFGLTVVFIAHDLTLVQFLCDRVAVMHEGRLVEQGEPRAVFADPQHAHTMSLLESQPVPDPVREAERAAARRVHRTSAASR